MNLTRRSILSASLAGSMGAALTLPTHAAVPEGCGQQPNTAPALQPPLLLTDWAWLGRYREDNAKLLARGARVNVVFMGDSITEGWARTDTDLFASDGSGPRGIVGRGISAQTTPQMLVRFQSDVVALRPGAVHIMAGTNDIAGNTGPMALEDTKNNFRAMCEIAKANKMFVVLGASPPASRYWWSPATQPHDTVVALNEWLRDYAKQIGGAFADYAAALSDGKGGVNRELAKDEVHPNEQGYAAMRRIVEAIL